MRRIALALVAASALALPASAAAQTPIFRIRPATVDGGGVIKIDGHPGKPCGPDKIVTIYSRAFPDTDHEFAGIHAVYAEVRDSGWYTKHVRIPSSREGHRYAVGARCGGASLGTLTLTVD